MNILLSLVFVVFCQPGVIWESDGTSTDLIQIKDKDLSIFQYGYELEYENGTYLYVSEKKDSVYFIIEGEDYYYESGDSTKFEIQK